MAAYNAIAGGALELAESNDQGDPLLFMKSLPYYETRAYVNIVMRNYWIQWQEGCRRLPDRDGAGHVRTCHAKGVKLVRLSHADGRTRPAASMGGGSD